MTSAADIMAKMQKALERDSAERHAWESMIQRCTNEKHPGYKNYGDRGIKVCDRWMSFSNFLEDMGPRPEGMSLERKEVNGNYEPGNCKWATFEEQQNNRTNNVRLTYKGETKTLSQWAREQGLPVMGVWSRIQRLGWPLEKALTTPMKTKKVSHV